MRRLLTIALILVSSFLWAQEVYYESTPTLLWDAVTTDVDGNAFLPDDTVEYEVLSWDMSQGDITLQPVSALSALGTVATTEMQLSFPYRTEWAIAIRTKHTDGGGNVTYSELAYSVVQEDTATGPFWYSPVLLWLPSRPTDLRDSGM